MSCSTGSDGVSPSSSTDSRPGLRYPPGHPKYVGVNPCNKIGQTDIHKLAKDTQALKRLSDCGGDGQDAHEDIQRHDGQEGRQEETKGTESRKRSKFFPEGKQPLDSRISTAVDDAKSVEIKAKHSIR